MEVIHPELNATQQVIGVLGRRLLARSVPYGVGKHIIFTPFNTDVTIVVVAGAGESVALGDKLITITTNDGVSTPGSLQIVVAGDPTADEWLSISGDADVLPVGFAIAHPCNVLGGANWAALNANIDEDYIYLSGDGGQWGAVSVSRVAQYRKSTGVWAYLTGVGGVRAAAPAAGSKLMFIPGYPNRLWSNRGGASNIIDYYSFSTDGWTALATSIPARVLNAGTEMCQVYNAPGLIAVRSSDEPTIIQVLDLSVTPHAYRTVAAMEGTNGTVHGSNGLLSWAVDGEQFFGITPHGGSLPQKIQVPLPL